MKIVITPAKFDQEFSIDDWFNLSELTNKQLYEKLLKFATDESGQPLTPEQAREEFKKIPKTEWNKWVIDFYRAITDAFVNPTSGGS
jgi:hypothetical protein